MAIIKKYLGFVWIILAFLTLYFLIESAMHSIKPHAVADINKPLPWIIIIIVFTPIAIGMALFGYYGVKGEYDDENEES
jgi:hypothetical protein